MIVNKTIPEIEEDARDVPVSIDLDSYFEDPDGAGPLSYSIELITGGLPATLYPWMTIAGSVLTVDPQDFYVGVIRVTATDTNGDASTFDISTVVENSKPDLVPELRKCFPFKVGEIGTHSINSNITDL